MAYTIEEALDNPLITVASIPVIKDSNIDLNAFSDGSII